MRLTHLLTVAAVFASTTLYAQANDQQFADQMKKYLASDAGQESIATTLQNFARKQQEKAMSQKLDEQFKNPVKIDVGNSPVMGAANAPITVVEFSDFECPFCKRGASTVEELMKAYPDKVKVVFKHKPLPFHKNAMPAAKASMAAHKQGKFAEYMKELFDNQQKLSDAFYEETATKLGLKLDQFKKDAASKEIEEAIKADEAMADKYGVDGTPSFFINGVQLQGAQPLPEFKRVVDRWLSSAAK